MTDVLVTGAAGGLGSALVDLLVARGDRVVALDRSDAPRDGVLSYVTDVGDDRAVERALAEAAREGIHPRHVVAIAGGALPDEKTSDDPAAISLELFRASLEHNLVSVWATVRVALPRLRRLDGDRSITFTTSTARSQLRAPSLLGGEAGLIGLRPLAHRHARQPTGSGSTRSHPAMCQHERNRRGGRTRANWCERLRAGVSARAPGLARDIATAFAALIDLQHVTGQVIVVDGGRDDHRATCVGDMRVATLDTIRSASPTVIARCRATSRATASPTCSCASRPMTAAWAGARPAAAPTSPRSRPRSTRWRRS